HFRHHVLPDPASAATAGEAASGNGKNAAARRHGHQLRGVDRQGNEGRGRRSDRGRDRGRRAGAANAFDGVRSPRQGGTGEGRGVRLIATAAKDTVSHAVLFSLEGD